MFSHERQVGNRDTGLGVAATPGRVLYTEAVTDCLLVLSLKLERKENLL